MQEGVLQRIRKIIDLQGLSDRKFAEEIGIPQTTLSNLLKRGNEPNVSIVNAILRRFSTINPYWLLTGNGEMNISLDEFLDDEDLKTKQLAKGKVGITHPRIPYTASAGSLTHCLEGVREVDCEQIPVIHAFPEYNFTIFIKGDSMEPKYESGDEVACKRIDNTHFIQWGKVHVLDTAQGIVIKRIYEESDGIRCVSFNAEYPDFTIPKNEIYSMSLVVGLLRV